MTNEEAIEIFSKVKELPCGWCYEGGDEFRQAINLAINALEESKQGEWLWLGDNPNSNHKWSCNKCGRGVKEQENYCPNCGAKMKGGAE